MGIASNPPLSRSRWYSCILCTRLKIVWMFVSVPPSHRWLTKGIPQRLACISTLGWICFLVPTNRSVPPPATMSRTNE